VATTFRPEAAYESLIGGASAQQNRCIGVLFSDPASDGSQTLRVLTELMMRIVVLELRSDAGRRARQVNCT